MSCGPSPWQDRAQCFILGRETAPSEPGTQMQGRVYKSSANRGNASKTDTVLLIARDPGEARFDNLAFLVTSVDDLLVLLTGDGYVLWPFLR